MEEIIVFIFKQRISLFFEIPDLVHHLVPSKPRFLKN